MISFFFKEWKKHKDLIMSLLPIVVLALGMFTTVNFIVLASALNKLKDQANEGAQAKRRQCELFPISKKLYSGAAKYRIITYEDLVKLLKDPPSNCDDLTEASK